MRPSDRPADLPDPFDVDLLRRRAKDLRRAALAGDDPARERVRKAHPRFGRQRLTDGDLSAFTLRDAQLCVARELGFDGWAAVLAHAQGQTARLPWKRWPDDERHRMFRRAVEVAQDVGTSTVGPECALGLLVRPPAEGPAATVLAGLGLTWQRWLDRTRPHFAPQSAEARDEVGTNPGWHALTGVAAGIALASGARRMADEHVLLALAYHRTSAHPSELELVGVAPDDVVSALARLGIAVSDLLPPAPSAEVRPFGPRVYFGREDHDAVVRALVEAYEPEAGFWGFNTDAEGRPYVEGEAALDLEGVARAAVDDPATVEAVPRSAVRDPGRRGQARLSR